MRKYTLIFLFGAILLICNGCLTSNEFNYIERTIKKESHPVKVRTNFKFSFGPISLSTVRKFVNFTDEGKKANKYLTEIDNVQVGVYEIQTDQLYHLKIPYNVEQKLNNLGWQMFVRVKGKDEHVNLFYKQINEQLSSLYVIVLEDEELVIVEVKGKLDALIEQAIHEHGISFKDI